jgi:hypothetical protein
LLCKATLEGGLSTVIERSDLLVSLLDEDKVPIRAWAVYDSFPVKWQVDGFTSTKIKWRLNKSSWPTVTAKE